ncbi:polyprenol reductase [Bacillus rossius redtenbacheri]|uniref:polyprenol reductase n=1 Tax=Bacillus rossius redtenbacheri TaxID=93214 RepID=UPI002FDC849D
MEILVHTFYEISFLKIVFSLMTLFMIIGGGLMNNIEHFLPVFFTQTFRYGKFAYRGKPSSLKLIEVPKRWFKHFYVFGAVYTTLAMATAFYVYFLSGTSPSYLSALLDLLTSRDRKASGSAESCFLALCLLTIHTWHRLYETWCVSIFSESRINIAHYVVGYLHYFGSVSAILAESPGFTNTKDLNATFRLKDITSLDIYGCALFLWACYHQYKCAVILANLRKNHKGEVVTYEHRIPHGDWFELVSSPHLLSEVLMYLALALVLRGSHTWLFVFLWVFCNQVESALLAHWWYLSNFKDYPKQRRAILPYIL